MEEWWKVDVRKQQQVETTVVVHELRFIIHVVVVIRQVTSGSSPFGVVEADYSGMFQARIGGETGNLGSCLVIEIPVPVPAPAPPAINNTTTIIPAASDFSHAARK
jgi:hypothetical protein